MSTEPSAVSLEERITTAYNNRFKNSAYSIWEYAETIQRCVLREGEDWGLFLKTGVGKRKKWRVDREIDKHIKAIGDDDLREIKRSKNGDCAVFAAAVVTDMSPDSFTYLGDGEHTLAYSTIGDEVFIIDSMFKKNIKLSTDYKPMWAPSRKLAIDSGSDGSLYYPDAESGLGLIMKRKGNPATIEVWRVKKDLGTGSAKCYHRKKCGHEPFKELPDWRYAIRQSLTHWTMEGHCVIVFRRHVDQGPGFDGQIDFRAGGNSIVFKWREIKNKVRCQIKEIYEFKKVTEDDFPDEKEPERKACVIRKKFGLKVAFFARLDQFLGMTISTNRKEQFESTSPIFTRMLDRMEIVLGLPQLKETKTVQV